MFLKQTTKLVIIFATIALVASGCSLSSNSRRTIKPQAPELGNNNSNKEIKPVSKSIKDQLAAETKIKKFNNYAELKEFLSANNNSGNYNNYGLGGAIMEKSATAPMVNSLGAVRDTAKSALAESVGGVSPDYSRTNVQVKGVDEADIIKTDGKYIYAVVKNNLYIIQAYPATTEKILSKIAFKSRPRDIYINGNRLIIFGRDSQIYKTENYKRWHRHGTFTFFKVFDITNPQSPKQIRDLDFEGNYFDSRMIGDYVYFVAVNYRYYYVENEPIVPRLLENGQALSENCGQGGKCFAPPVYYFDIPYQSYNFTSVNAINIKDPNKKVNSEVYLLPSQGSMYVSKNNIYLTYTKYINEYQLEEEVLKEIVYPRLSKLNQEKINKIQAVEHFILTPEEKLGKISRIIENYSASLSKEKQDNLEKKLAEAMKKKYQDISKELEKTVIHKIAIKDGNLQYKTFAEVTGRVLNQFSMDEYNGYFRIATTKDRTWSRYVDKEDNKSYTNLYVLDKNLKPVGAVENLASGERIYSVRFMQNRAYLSTFKQIDPLFVIGLNNPSKPIVLGKLKLPGFSTYLHPYNNNILIGLGKDTAESEWGGVRTKGLKLVLFDVSNVSNPKIIDTYIMGDAGSDSIALRDHKAFLFSKEKNLLVIPVSIRKSMDGKDWGKISFRGATVLTVNKNGFKLKGKISHNKNYGRDTRDYWGGYNYYNNTVKRALCIGNTLYTFSNNYLKANKLDDLSLIKNLKLKKNKSNNGDDFEIIN